jgi:hypothetical protein
MLIETVMKCLNRDVDWVAYHASEMAEAAHAAPVNMPSLRIDGVYGQCWLVDSASWPKPTDDALRSRICSEFNVTQTTKILRKIGDWRTVCECI